MLRVAKGKCPAPGSELILPLHLYKISAAGLSSLDNYFGNVSYYVLLPIIFALEVFKQDNFY